MLTIRKCNLEFEKSTFPYRLLLAWDAAFPFLEVHHALGVAHWFCEKAEGVVASPLLPVLYEYGKSGRLAKESSYLSSVNLFMQSDMM